jgi:hypothetical protein
MKTVKVNHVILTLGFSASAIASGAGESRDEVDKKINARLAEGYDDVQVIPLKSNFSDSLQLESVVNEYIFRKYEDAPAKPSKKE